jgi:hypothetical protein
MEGSALEFKQLLVSHLPFLSSSAQLLSPYCAAVLPRIGGEVR